MERFTIISQPMDNEKIIVSLTTWTPRLKNIPIVLDSIFSQTVKPDKVVLNLSEGEKLPSDLCDYLKMHEVEVCYVPDTKVYKKLVPTLRRYPDDCVISIDDDWIYPSEMIEDFMSVHRQSPDNPISGNKAVYHGCNCHCGCASMMKLKWLGKYVNFIDEELMKNCPCDDLVYTYLTKKNGYRYVRTEGLYFTNMCSYCSNEPYSESDINRQIDTWNYLVMNFGSIFEKIIQIIRKRKKRS